MLLDSGLKLSDIIVTLCSKLLDYILYFGLYLANTKNVMYLNVVYTHMLHCMIKLWPELAHQASHFGIWFVQIGQIEVDINQFNILELGHIYLEAVASLNKWELVRTGFSHMSGRQNQG